MNRRNFFRALKVGLAGGVALAAGLPVLPKATSSILPLLSGWRGLGNNPTLSELARAIDPDKTVKEAIDILNETNEVLADMDWVEGSQLLQTSLPTATWRKLYLG